MLQVYNLFLKFCKKIPLLLILVLFNELSYSQNNELINLTIENQTLKYVLQKLDSLTEYTFAYSDSEINSTRIISINQRQSTIYQIVSTLCNLCSLEAEYFQHKILLKPSRVTIFHVSGTVCDSLNSEPIPGANLCHKGSRIGTVTDENGNFMIEVSSVNNSISVSFVGYSTQIIDIKSDTIINILLKENIETLSEVIVVAFGNEERDVATGSVSVIQPSKYQQINQNSINTSLQSTSSGVFVQNNSGTAGASINLIIRGISSITAGNSPLYVVDEIPVISGNFSQLNFSGQTLDAINDLSINNIESITILKDAAASSLFGSNASNGVVLVNTKRGAKNENSLQFISSFGWQQTTGKLKLLNAQQWMILANEQAFDNNSEPVFSDEEIRNNTTDTDWLNEVFRRAPLHNLNVSFSGGQKNSSFFISADSYKQTGIVIGNHYERYSFLTNYDYRFNERFSVELGNNFSYTKNDRVEGDQTINGPLPNAISQPAIFPVYNPDGSYNNEGPFANPVSIANDEINTAFSFRNLTSFGFNLQIFKNLNLKSKNGLDYYNLREQTFAPKTTRQGAKYNGLGIEATNHTIYLYNSTYLTYNYLYNNHRFDLVSGFSFDSFKLHNTYLRAQNFPGNSFQFLQSAATPIATNSHESRTVSNSLFMRLKYSFVEKYIFTANLRRDGSSKFGANNRFGYFPAISALWYVSKEAFFPKQNIFTKLKLSSSYGITGNDNITDFLSLDLFSASSNYNGEAGISPFQLSNPNLKWETTNQLNFAVDFDLFNQISFRFEYYNKKTKDLLLEKPMPGSTGYKYIISNIGKLENKGYEIEISANFQRNELMWNTIFSFSMNNNKVLELYENQSIRNIGRASSSIEEGKPVSFFYGFISNGVNPENGNLIYADINYDDEINELDRTKIGSPFPLFFGGLQQSITYKQLSINALFNFSYKNNIYNATRMYTETLSGIDNQTIAVLNRWRKAGDNSEIPKASSYNERVSSRFVEDGSFIRLKSLKISYLISEKLLNKTPFAYFEIYIAGKNLWTLTNYSGMDPEVNYNGTNSIIIGTDLFTCPQAKSLIMGICIKF